MKYRFGLKKSLVLMSTLILLLYLLLVLLCCGLFMNRFYIYQSKQQLRDAYEEVLQHPDGDLETMAELERGNLAVLIFDPETMEVIYNTRADDRLQFPLAERARDMISEGLAEAGADYFITVDTPRSITAAGVEVNFGRTLYLGGQVGDRYVEITMNMEPLNKAVYISIQFSIIFGLAIMLIAALLYAKMSNIITKPIIEMTEAAQKIAQLDFSRRCDENRQNEIGTLAKSVNSMSDRMQQYIQELQEANAHLKEDIAQREKSEQARKSLISNISHDLKTPIALISGYADGLRSGMAKTPEQVQEYCGVISDETDRMLDLTSRMLELSRIESGSVKLNPEDFDLGEMLEYLLGLFRVELERGGVTLKRDFPESIYVTADYYAVEQVLTNLIQNAVFHMGDARQMRVTVTGSGRLRVTVFNSADPFPPEELEKFWDSFYRGEPSRARRQRETGLGLAIVRGNMELMGMPYGVRNAEGGIEFWIELPEMPPSEEV